jgi:hypothetical protein
MFSGKEPAFGAVFGNEKNRVIRIGRSEPEEKHGRPMDIIATVRKIVRPCSTALTLGIVAGEQGDLGHPKWVREEGGRMGGLRKGEWRRNWEEMGENGEG